MILWLKSHSRGRIPNFRQTTPKIGQSIMTADLVGAFLVMILKWLEIDDSIYAELVERMECFAECLTRVVRHMGVSTLTHHLIELWIMIRRVQCVLRGIELESTANMSWKSIGAVSREQKGFASLVELDDPRLTFEIEANQLLLEEWILSSEPDEPLELALKLVRETFNDIRVVHRNLRQ